MSEVFEVRLAKKFADVGKSVLGSQRYAQGFAELLLRNLQFWGHSIHFASFCDFSRCL